MIVNYEKEAINLALDARLGEMLRRSIVFEKKGELERSARMLRHIGKKNTASLFSRESC